MNETFDDRDRDAIRTHFLHSIGTKEEFHYKKMLSDPKFERLLPAPRAKFSPVDEPIFTFIDLFAGIGGMRLAFQKLNGRCVFSSEWDKQAQITPVVIEYVKANPKWELSAQLHKYIQVP